MPNKWIIALKQWNTEKGGPWCVPRRDSAEYRAVRALMDGRPAPKKESDDERAAREGRNVARRQTALEQLRGVEAATQDRNVKREEEAAAKKAEAPKKKTIAQLRDEARARKEAAAPPPAEVGDDVELKDLLSEPLKKLKAGDFLEWSIPRGYMGDGGDDRDVGYSVDLKIMKVGKDNLSFKVISARYGLEKEYTVKVELGNAEWSPIRLSYSDRNDGTVTVPDAKYDGFFSSKADKERVVNVWKVLDAKRFKEKQSASAARAKKTAEKPLEDKPKAELVRMVEKWASEKGSSVRGLTVASKDTLLKFIKDNKITA